MKFLALKPKIKYVGFGLYNFKLLDFNTCTISFNFKMLKIYSFSLDESDLLKELRKLFCHEL